MEQFATLESTLHQEELKRSLSPEEVKKIDAYWRAANYLSVGQIYLLDNPLLKKPLTLQHIKRRLLGHWGTTPGLNFIYARLNRLIKTHDLDILFLAGPGHGGPGVVANVYLEGTYSEFYPNISQDEEGMRKLFKQFSFPGGIPIINVIDLMVLQPKSEHPHGLSDQEFDEVFTTDKPIIFAFHGYPWLIHRLTYRRANHKNLHVRGYKEEGTITTPFDMVVLNDLDRFHLFVDTVERVPRFSKMTVYIRELAESKLLEHKNYIQQFGNDIPEIRDWKWPY